jgi:predicted chitinase
MNTNEKIVYCRLKADGYTKQAIAAVMGVCAGESGFQQLKEAAYNTTSNQRIREIFGSRLSSYSESALTTLKQSYNAFFDAVYGNMYGNAANEGGKYVGRGFNGITFKDNYIAYGNKLNAAYNENIDLAKNPELLENPKYAAMALSQYMQPVKNITNYEAAFQEAFRYNAGPANSFAYYAASTNPVAVYGIPLKRKKGQAYLDAINAGEFSDACGGSNLGPLGASGILTSFPIIFFLTLGGYYLYKKFRK